MVSLPKQSPPESRALPLFNNNSESLTELSLSFQDGRTAINLWLNGIHSLENQSRGSSRVSCALSSSSLEVVGRPTGSAHQWRPGHGGHRIRKFGYVFEMRQQQNHFDSIRLFICATSSVRGNAKRKRRRVLARWR